VKLLPIAILAILRVLQAAFAIAFAERHTRGAFTAFTATVTDVTILSIGAPFWGLVFGVAISWLLERGDREPSGT
jgi:benzoate membrane transport protein